MSVMPRLATVGAKRRVVHRDADHQAEREQRVDDSLAELGLRAIFLVEMQRGRIVGHAVKRTLSDSVTVRGSACSNVWPT